MKTRGAVKVAPVRLRSGGPGQTAGNRKARKAREGVLGLPAVRVSYAKLAKAPRSPRCPRIRDGTRSIAAPARETVSPGRAPPSDAGEKPNSRLFTALRLRRPGRLRRRPVPAVGGGAVGYSWAPGISAHRTPPVGGGRGAGVVLGVLASWRLGEPDTGRRESSPAWRMRRGAAAPCSHGVGSHPHGCSIRAVRWRRSRPVGGSAAGARRMVRLLQLQRPVKSGSS